MNKILPTHAGRCGAILTLVLILALTAHAQETSTDTVSLPINKQVSDCPDRFDLSTPLNAFVTHKYLQAKGRQSLYRSVNSYRLRGYFPTRDAPDIAVKEDIREDLLGTHIKEVITCKDSVAAVITEISGSLCIITYMSLENGEWRSAGEDWGRDLKDSRVRFLRKAPMFQDFVFRIARLQTISSDTAAFVDYLKKNREQPKVFLLDALAEHKIVIYGELHRRKASWNLLKETISDPAFIRRTGTVFMELSSDKQGALDRFFSAGKLDRGIILDIFRDVQLSGWYDRGGYEFLTALWMLNHRLPETERIRVIAVDIPRPFSSFGSLAAMDAHFAKVLDRNEHMATLIAEAVNRKTDARNSLFIVGFAHAYKSSAPGLGSQHAKPTAGAQLADLFSDHEVFTIFPHCPVIENDGTVHGQIRDGLFDKVFAILGNDPMAFRLKDNPFGREPFDGCHEISFNNQAGNFDDNFDGYLFLGPLKEEQEEYLLYDVITDEFVEELKRRAAMTKESVEEWFGVTVASRDAIVSAMKEQTENKKRWPKM